MSDDTHSGPPPTTHDRKGKFTPGNNMRQKVREQRQKGMSRRIAQATGNGMEMVETALEIMRDKGHRDRLKAVDWLTIRMCGKVPDKVEVTGEDGKPLNPLHGFTAEQLLALASAKTEGEK